MRIKAICFTGLLFFLITSLSAQVIYDNNATEIGAANNVQLIQNAFTVPAGNDRVLVAFVMRDGSSSTTDSITYDGQQLTLQIETGTSGIYAEMWSLTLGCGSEISDSLKAFFSHPSNNLPDASVATATFQNVDQFLVTGGSDTKTGTFSNSTGSPLQINTADTGGLIIGSVSTDATQVSISPNSSGQMEIYEQSIGDNGAQGSTNTTTGGVDQLSWGFTNFCTWAAIGIELLEADQDGDGNADCDDLCPLDPLKSEPGLCGCGVEDIDTDGDGTLDCNDLCPLDSLKISPGICGCGIEDTDSDGNGIADCVLPHVTYDSNAVVIAAIASATFVQGAITVPEGTDRLLVAFITRDGFNSTTDSVTFNGQHMTNHIQQAGSADLNAEIWYLTLGCGAEITNSIQAYFQFSGGGGGGSGPPDVIVAAASFQHVNQSIVFGDSQSQFGQGSNPPSLFLNTADTTGLIIGTVSTDITSGTINISPNSPGQVEIFETSISGNNNSSQGSIKVTSGGSDELRWSFSNFSNWVIIGIELLGSDQDGDGIADCDDLCPTDPLKSEPGACGCGVEDIDTDGDGTLDCNDLCPLDSLKISPGICGCGIEDTDADSNGIADCVLPRVMYDSNTVVIGTMANANSVQDLMTVPEGNDRLLVAFVTRDGFNTITDSITFNGQQMTKQIQQAGGGDLFTEIWYLTLGCGPEITSSMAAYFRSLGGGGGGNGLPDVIVAGASYQNVDQVSIFGATQRSSGSGGSTGTLNLNTADTTGLIIATVATDANSGTVNITPNSTGQFEVFEAFISGNNNSSQGSIKETSGGVDQVSWSFSNSCNWVNIALELLVSDQDGDGIVDCDDLCPTDPLKSEPGICGCGVVDLDTDGDGTFDCNDLCPLDSLKIEPGICGCGTVDTDADSNGLADCITPRVTYDSNAVVIGALPSSTFIQGSFTVPEGIDRLLVAFVTRDGSNTITDSITFNGQHMTNQIQQAGQAELNTEIWTLSLGCGAEITDQIAAHFRHLSGGPAPDIIVAGASFHFVDQSMVFGSSDSRFGEGSSSAPLVFNATDTTGLLIGTISTDVTSGFITIASAASGQTEIFEGTISGNNNSSQGSIKTPTGSTDNMLWSISGFCRWTAVGLELLVSDQDGDNVFDCNDLCPLDSLKTEPGICGCGIEDIDTDMDGTVDCNDLCPLDPLKIEPGFCGCGVIESLVDTDVDGTPDCADLCPLDSFKIDPGICGCGVADTDTDGDGTVDCIDVCPNDSTLIADMDSDGDGVADCVDPCPFDSLKVEPGLCGCGIPDIDSDMDGIPDCGEAGDVLLFAGANAQSKGPLMQGHQAVIGGDTTLLWSIGNLLGTDSAVTFMQHRNDNLHFAAGNVIGMTLDSIGHVGIGMQPTTFHLEVNGSASKSTPGNWLGNSDARLKTNITPLDPKMTLYNLLELQGVTYMWNDTVTGLIRPRGMQYGLLAQDIQKIYPELVVEDANGFLQTSYGTFDPMIIEGIRFIDQEINTMEAEVDDLFIRLQKVESKLRLIKGEEMRDEK